MEFQSGDTVGPYTLETLIGAGGMGRVFRAVDTRLRRTIAIKFMLASDKADSDGQRRFLKEARAASALNHPNIVAIHDISSHDGIDFLVMEYVSGQTLKDLISGDGMPFETVVHLGSQIASALAAAHGAGIVHRDIKPANIIVTPDQQVKVLDFGIAKVSSNLLVDPEGPTTGFVEVTTPGMLVGTVSYMSPEQTRSETLDGRSDIFSLGCVLYEAATGQRPFRGESTLAIMHAIATGTPAAPSSLRGGLPNSFDRLIAACLEKQPNRRPSSASELANELKRLTSSPSGGSAFARPVRPSVAVVPFQLRAATPEDQFLSVSLADAVIHRLSSTGKLLVRPIASVLKYKSADTDWREVARDLNVDFVVAGTIQKMGSKVRVLMQAHSVRDVATLHSTKLDGDVDDLFGLQDRVADLVCDAFLPNERQPEVAVAPTKNPLASELYMRAVDRLAHLNKFDISSAIEMLSRVIEIDPLFADAWGRLAQAYVYMGMHLDPEPKWFQLGEQAIARTLELDAVQCDALCARGMMLFSPTRGFKTAAALRALNAAVKVNPSRYNVRMLRSGVLFHLGFYEDSQRDVEEALLMNPRYAMSYQCLGMVAQYRGDFATADEYNQRSLEIDPTLVLANIFAPFNSLMLRRMDEARQRIGKARQMAPGEPQLTVMESLIAAHEGDFVRAERLADEASAENRKSVTHTHHTWHYAAGAYAMCGKPDKAIHQLRRCAELGLPNYLLFTRDPLLRTIQDEPEFTSLMSDLRRQYDQYHQEFGFIREN